MLYEDDGVSTEYLDLGFSHTPVSFQQDMHRYIFSMCACRSKSSEWQLLYCSLCSQFNLTIGPTSGSFTGLPSERSYQIEIPNFYSGNVILLFVHGKLIIDLCFLFIYQPLK